MPPNNQESCNNGERDSYLEPAAMKPPGVFWPEVLGNIACHADAAFDSRERADFSDALLNDMRIWLRESEVHLLRLDRIQKWREHCPSLFSKMKGIHRIDVAADPENSLSDNASELLLANYIRYLDNNNLDTELTSGQLTALYEAYANDVKVYRDIKVTNPERVAYYQGKQDLSGLINKYGGFDFICGDDFIKAMHSSPMSPEIYLERLIRDVVHFQMVSEPGLREEYGFSGKPWSSAFIASLSRKFPDPEQAARNIFESIPKLRDAYKHATEDTVERWARQIITGHQSKRRVEIDELLKEVPVITIESSERDFAAKALSQLRKALLNGEISVKAGNHNSAGVHRLVRIAEMNWHESFEEADMFGAARSIHFMIKAYNAYVLKAKANTPPITTTAVSLYHILVAFTSDISALKKEVTPARAARVARYYSPGVCRRLHEQLQDKDVPISAISKLMAEQPKGIMNAIEKYSERRDILKEMLKPEKLVGLPGFARRGDGVERARKYLAFLPKARERYHWVSRADVAWAFYSSDAPVTQFNTWAKKVETIRRLTNKDANRIGSTDFSVLVVKRLAKDKRRSADTIIEAHTKRCNELYAPYKDNSFVTRAMISLWITRRSAPENAIKDHLKRVDKVRELLIKAGEDDRDDILVRDLAFYNNDSQKTVARYLDIKKVLELERGTWDEEYSDIEQWMIVQVASRSNGLKYAKRKLKILSWLTRHGRLLSANEAAYQQKNQLIDKTTAEKDSGSFVGLNHVAALVDNLHELDKMAVLAVFGFDEEYGEGKTDAKWLEGELGVSNLEAYVMEDVVPHIRSIDKL